MDFDGIELMVAGILTDGGIKFTCGNDEQQSDGINIPEHLAVVFHMNDDWRIKITQPCVRETHTGFVMVDCLIRTGVREFPFNMHTIDAVFKRVLTVEKPQRRRPEEDRDDAVIAAVTAEGEAIDALVRKMLRRSGVDATNTAAIFLLKTALLHCVQVSTQWRSSSCCCSCCSCCCSYSQLKLLQSAAGATAS